MAEETTNQQPPVVQTETRQTSEVIDVNGNSASSASSLAAIFDKIESGQAAKDAVTEVMKPEPVIKAAPVDDEPETVQPPPVEDKPKNLDEQLSASSAAKDKQAADVRAELEKKLEAKPVDATAKPDAPVDVVPDDELKVLPYDKPKTAKRIQALLSKIDAVTGEATRTKQEAQEKAAKLAELEEKLKSTTTVDPKTLEDIKKKEEELSMFRRRYQLDKDPEVKTRFDSRVESAEKSIASVLTKFRGGDVVAKMIQEEGGWSNFSNSGKKFILGDGKATTGSELAEAIYNELPMTDKRAIDAALIEQTQTKRERDRFFEEQTSTANDFFKKQEEEQNKVAQARQQEYEANVKAITTWEQEVVTKTDWLKEKEIPATATPEERDRLKNDNDYTKQLNGLLKQALYPKDLKGALEAAYDSVKYWQERRTSAAKDAVIQQQAAQIKELQEKFDKFKTAGRSTLRGPSIASPAGSTPGADAKRPQSLEEALDMQNAGVNLRELINS